MKSQLAGVAILVMISVVTGMSAPGDAVARSAAPRVRGEAERARWNKQRGMWDTEPGTYQVALPDFHHSSPSEMMGQANEAHSNLRKVADETVMWVADDRLTLERRFEALALTRLFSPELTAKKLIQIVDFQGNDSGFVSGRPVFGQYPVVEVLQQYGSSVLPFVNGALANETIEARRKLLCDVVQHVAGAEDAKQQLEAYIARHDLKEHQRANCDAALAEFEHRAK